MGQNRRGAGEERGKKYKVNISFKIIAIVFAVISILFYINILKLNMLTTKYLVILTAVLVIVTGLIILGLIRRKRGNAGRIILTILSVLIVSVYLYGMNYMNATMKFVDVANNVKEETEDYYVIVLKNSKFNEITDLDGKNMHVFLANENYDDVQNDILQKAKVYFKEDDSLESLSKDILSGKSYAALVTNSQYLMLKEDYKDFEEKTKIIYTATHKIEKSKEVAINKNGKNTVENGIFNIYISGIDTTGKISNVARTDANMIVSVNTKTHEVLITSIPRDYYVMLHSKKAKDKLTHSGIYGIDETVSTAEDLLGIDINYYVRVNFTTLIKIVDTLGGIDVNSDYAFTAVSGEKFTKGINHLDGDKALAFSRERIAFPSGDHQRVINQQKVVTAIMNKVLSSKTILTKYTSLLKSLSGSFQTNISQDEISTLVKGQLDNMTGWNIDTVSLSGTGANMTTYSYGNQKLYVMIPNEKTVLDAKNKISTVLGK